MVAVVAKHAGESHQSDFSIERVESSVLACLLTDNDSWWINADKLSESLFIGRRNRLVFKAIQSLLGAGEPADIVTASDFVERIFQENVTQYIAENILSIPVVVSNASTYIDRLRNQQMERLMTSVSTGLSQVSMRTDLSVEEKLNEFTSAVTRVTQEVVTTKAKTGGEIVDELIERMKEREARGDKIGGLSTGFSDLDSATDGLHEGDLIVIAGRPSMGKTTLAMNIAENASVKQGKPVFVASLEMPAYKLSMRMVSSIGDIASDRIRKSNLNEGEWKKFREVSEMIRRSPLLVTDNFDCTVTDIRASCARFKADNQGELGLIVIDYLQLMRPEKGTEHRSETEKISEISRKLKGLAKDMGCPVIVLSQLNRSLEARADKRPMMSDLRSSGAIEQDADLILFVYRDEVYDVDTQYAGYGEIIIGKQRDGELATIFTRFEGRYSKFAGLSQQEYTEVQKVLASEDAE